MHVCRKKNNVNTVTFQLTKNHHHRNKENKQSRIHEANPVNFHLNTCLCYERRETSHAYEY